MQAILTVVGQDKIGIIAGISNELANLKINIVDVSQTVMNNFFTMTMLCNIDAMSVSFADAKQALAAAGEKLGVQVKIQREEIFLAMHKL